MQQQCAAVRLAVGGPGRTQRTHCGVQVKQATMKAGAQDKRVAAQAYDLVLPDAVEFIASQALQGTLVRCLACTG